MFCFCQNYNNKSVLKSFISHTYKQSVVDHHLNRVSSVQSNHDCFFTCVSPWFPGDPVPSHLVGEPEQPSLLVLAGAGGADAGRHPL